MPCVGSGQGHEHAPGGGNIRRGGQAHAWDTAQRVGGAGNLVGKPPAQPTDVGQDPGGLDDSVTRQAMAGWCPKGIARQQPAGSVWIYYVQLGLGGATGPGVAGGRWPFQSHVPQQGRIREESGPACPPVALKPWGKWYGPGAAQQAIKAAEEKIGGSVAASIRHNYEGRFKKWETFRGANGLNPYLDTTDDKFPAEEDSASPYVALPVGPLGKEVSTMVTHLSAIGYLHRARRGINPLTQMSRVQLMLKGLKRAKGPANRKLPASLEDLRAL